VSVLIPTLLQVASGWANGLGGYAVIHPNGYVCGTIVATSIEEAMRLAQEMEAAGVASGEPSVVTS